MTEAKLHPFLNKSSKCMKKYERYEFVFEINLISEVPAFYEATLK